MKTILPVTIIIIASIFLFSFILGERQSPADVIKDYYAAQYRILVKRLESLQTAIKQNKSEPVIKNRFLGARLAYKQIEFLVEYYFELDVNKINGPPVEFIEEEDPAAYQEPQGFQMIESFLYPHYDTVNKQQLMLYAGKLLDIATGLGNNAAMFTPDEFVADAAMEELYRIIALAITGFDSPLAHLSLDEAQASLNSIAVVWKAYQQEITDKKRYAETLHLLAQAKNYLQKNRDFNSFDRMHFISDYLNPICDHVATLNRYINNPSRFCVISKSSTLFNEQSLQTNIYLGDDTLTAGKIQLGKKLFSEPLLSANSKRSCASCHQQQKAFTDGLPKALQLDDHISLPRNSPSLWNASLQKNLFSDSRQVSLDYLIMEVLSNEKEMNKGFEDAAEKIKDLAEYRALFEKAYPTDTLSAARKGVNAIAMYLRTLVSYNSRFDQYMRGNKDRMTATEIRGFNLFAGKARCATCHFMPLFNGSKPPTYFYQESEVIGVPATTDTIHPVLDGDRGRFEVTKKEFHKNAFKTPSLRNIEFTAPYMHNGVYNTLEEVMDFYNKGGGEGLGIAPENLTLLPDKLNLTKGEISDIIAFMQTLTDTSGIGYVSKPTFR